MSNSTKSQPPALTYGGGEPLPRDVALRVYDILEKHGVKNVDTARIYPGSERLLGHLGAPKRFNVTTKWRGWAPGTGKKESILDSVKVSLEELKVEKVDIWLLHSPDTTVPFSETVEAIQEVYKQGRFNRWGISNFTAEQVQEIYDAAKSKNYVLPTVYQANYNLVSRRPESDLFPLLRSLGISIQVYSPIAAGFLVKTPEHILNPPEGTRWDPKTMYGGILQKLYNKPALLEYLRQFGELSEKSGVSRVGIAYRWVRYHSAIKGEFGDTVIFGASKEQQVEDTLTEIEKGPLEDSVVQKLEDLWKTIEKESPYNVSDVIISV